MISSIIIIISSSIIIIIILGSFIDITSIILTIYYVYSCLDWLHFAEFCFLFEMLCCLLT